MKPHSSAGKRRQFSTTALGLRTNGRGGLFNANPCGLVTADRNGYMLHLKAYITLRIRSEIQSNIAGSSFFLASQTRRRENFRNSQVLQTADSSNFVSGVFHEHIFRQSLFSKMLLIDVRPVSPDRTVCCTRRNDVGRPGMFRIWCCGRVSVRRSHVGGGMVVHGTRTVR